MTGDFRLGKQLFSHCGAHQLAKTYVLRCDSENAGSYSFQMLYILPKCSGSCGLKVIQWRGLNEKGLPFYKTKDGQTKPSPFNKIKQRDYDHWMQRVKTDIYEPQYPLISEATREMAQDTANVYQRVIKRAEAVQVKTQNVRSMQATQTGLGEALVV